MYSPEGNPGLAHALEIEQDEKANSYLDNLIGIIKNLPEADIQRIIAEVSADRSNKNVRSLAEVKEFNPAATLKVIDRIIEEVYLPYRGAPGYGTERAILVEAPHTPHRENDAEHSWHVEHTLLVLWDMRDELGIYFPPDFDLALAMRYAHDHDLMEIRAGDVNSTTKHKALREQKQDKEWKAHDYYQANVPHMHGPATTWANYESKDTYEAKLVSDLDKIGGTRMICLDGGKKWHNWEGEQCTREEMCTTYRDKLITPFGHALWDELERDLDNHPEYFPAQGEDLIYKYYPQDEAEQGRLFA